MSCKYFEGITESSKCTNKNKELVISRLVHLNSVPNPPNKPDETKKYKYFLST